MKGSNCTKWVNNCFKKLSDNHVNIHVNTNNPDSSSHKHLATLLNSGRSFEEHFKLEFRKLNRISSLISFNFFKHESP